MDWALIVTGRVLWVTHGVDTSPPTAAAGGGGKGVSAEELVAP